MEKHYEDNFLKFEYVDGILIGTFKFEKIDIVVARHSVKKRLEIFDDLEYPALADYTNVKETTKEARDFFASSDATKNFKAMAVLTDSMVGNMIYNFYVLLSKPPIPTKLFRDKEQAINWLKKYL